MVIDYFGNELLIGSACMWLIDVIHVVLFLERPRTSHRVPPGGRSNIVFSDEFTSSTEFQTAGEKAVLTTPKIEAVSLSPRRPSRKMFDGTRSMETVLSHSVDSPAAISSKRSTTSSKMSLDTIFTCSRDSAPVEKIYRKNNFIDRSSVSSLFSENLKPVAVRMRGYPGGASTFSFWECGVY